MEPVERNAKWSDYLRFGVFWYEFRCRLVMLLALSEVFLITCSPEEENKSDISSSDRMTLTEDDSLQSNVARK